VKEEQIFWQWKINRFPVYRRTCHRPSDQFHARELDDNPRCDGRCRWNSTRVCGGGVNLSLSVRWFYCSHITWAHWSNVE